MSVKYRKAALSVIESTTGWPSRTSASSILSPAVLAAIVAIASSPAVFGAGPFAGAS
jgi:hypothetical protein